MRKLSLDRETLSQEMRLAALKRMPFNYLLRNLRRDYNTSSIEDQKFLSKLNEAYDTMTFLVAERKVRYNMVG